MCVAIIGQKWDKWDEYAEPQRVTHWGSHGGYTRGPIRYFFKRQCAKCGVVKFKKRDVPDRKSPR